MKYIIAIKTVGSLGKLRVFSLIRVLVQLRLIQESRVTSQRAERRVLRINEASDLQWEI